MTYNVIMSAKANSSFNSIISHLLQLSGGSNIAKNFINDFEKKISLLSYNPEIFGYSRFQELKDKNYRYFLVKGYIALFKIEENNVVIANIFHQSQDYARLI